MSPVARRRGAALLPGRPSLGTVLLAGALAVTGACGGSPEDAGRAQERSATPSAASGRADDAGAGAGAPDALRGPVTFVFGGDVHFEGRVEASLGGRSGGPLTGMAGAFAPEDIVVVNLETAVTESDGAVAKQFTFKAPPEVLGQLVADGVDVVSLANNHGMDYGLAGLQDTLQAGAAAGLPIIGAGTSAAEAFAPWTATVGGHRVAVLAATQVLDSSFEAAWTAGPSSPGLASAKQTALLVDAVVRAAAEADTVAVVLHWGVEKDTCPTPVQQALARALVDAGADIVVGGHAHRLQAAGRLGDAIVGYGLGNLVFDTPDTSDGARSGMLRVRADGTGHLDYQWVPAALVGGLPRRLEGAAADAAVVDWTRLRDCTELTD